MRILVISHNVFSNSENMGKTLYKMFSGFQEKDISQLYFHSEVPTVEGVCNSYYRITDKDVLKSIFIRKLKGTRFSKEQIYKEYTSSRVDSGIAAKIYQKGRSRTPLIYLMRDCVWTVGNWFSLDLKQWLNENKPEVIFYAAGDYSFSYRIAYKISKYLQIPLILYCVDDYYLNNTNDNSVTGRMRHKLYMKQVNKTVDASEFIVTICEKMAEDYSAYFKKQCYTLYTAADNYKINFIEKPKRIAYFGSLGFKRDRQLVEIGTAIYKLKELTGIDSIDVFTHDKNVEALKKLSQSNGITLHKAVTEKDMLEILRECMAVIHTESFDESIRRRIRYSVSTKIAESLSFGPCLFVYGPDDVASIEYLQRYNAAYVVHDKKDLENGLLQFLSNENLREEIVKNARNTAKEKHCSLQNFHYLQTLFNLAVKK